MEYIFVSCDIIGHSREDSLERQRERVYAINEIVRETIIGHKAESVIWASGGDGGHVAFEGGKFAGDALELIVKLRSWSIGQRVPLRVVANTGEVERVQGADGRVQLVGHGINLAGRLLRFADQNRVVVTKTFSNVIHTAGLNDVQFHNPRVVRPTYFPPQQVVLLSIEGKFKSRWDVVQSYSDREALSTAIDQKNGLEVIYRARRLLQINPSDQDARNALRQIVKGGFEFLTRDNLMGELLTNKEFGEKYIRGMTLLERKKGDIVCKAHEEGQTMFMVLRGELGGYLPSDGNNQSLTDRTVDFTIAPGDLVGELAFALERKRTATLLCLEDTALLSFRYSDLLRSLSDSKQRDQLQEFLQRKIRSRILEQVCNSASFLVGKRSYGPPTGPLANHTSPWIDLLPYFDILEMDWTTKRFGPEDRDFSRRGVYILVSGKIEQIGGGDNILDGANESIIYAEVENDIYFKQHEYRLLKNIKIVLIEEAGFSEFGVETYQEIISSLQMACKISATGPIEDELMAKKHLFLSYGRENLSDISQLRDDLIAAGELVWWDQDILPGQDWKMAIRQAMRDSYAVVLCLSKETEARSRSGIFPEALDAIGVYREYSPGNIFLIPVRLSRANIPPIEIDATRTLDRLQYVDLFPSSKRSDGLGRLIQALQNTPEHP